MVKDRTNQVYTELIQYLKSIYSPIFGGMTYSESEPELPFVYFFQMDAPTALTTLSNTEDGINSAYQIEVYSDNGMNHAREISNDIRAYMIKNGFRCITFRPMQAPSTVNRFLSRYMRLDV